MRLCKTCVGTLQTVFCSFHDESLTGTHIGHIEVFVCVWTRIGEAQLAVCAEGAVLFVLTELLDVGGGLVV